MTSKKLYNRLMWRNEEQRCAFVPVTTSLNRIEHILIKVREMLYRPMSAILTFSIHHSVVQALTVAILILNKENKANSTAMLK